MANSANNNAILLAGGLLYLGIVLDDANSGFSDRGLALKSGSYC
jgi:hypothetical protein